MTHDPAAVPRWLRVLRNPILRILIFVALAFAIGWTMRWLIPSSGRSMEQAMELGGADLWLGALRSLLPFALAYWLLVRAIEGRRVDELALRQLLPKYALGTLVGLGLMLATAALLAAFGAYRIDGWNPQARLLAPLLVLGVIPGIAEEILFRGVIFRIVEDGLGTWIALVLSALLFGAAHMANPNATLWSAAAIAIEAGLLLGLAYAWTRSLWFCMGLHMAWNFTQGAILGISVSGIAVHGLFESRTQGPDWLSGGEFGAEASVLALLVCLAMAAYCFRRAVRGGQIRPPFWRRVKAAAAAPEPAPDAT